MSSYALLRLKVNGYTTTQMRKVKNYYFSVADYIPSTTLRGAILAEYYHQTGKIDESFFVSPAYPINTAPAHYFSPAEKRKASTFIEKRGILKEKSEELDKGKEMIDIMELDDPELKPKIGALITYLGKEDNYHKYTAYRSEAVILQHVAVSKGENIGTSERGMLFAYEYKKLGEMWAIAKPSEVVDTVKEIRVGRGRSRGNKAIVIEKVKEIEIPDGKGLSYCLSPCVTSLFGKEIIAGKKQAIGDTSLYSGWFTLNTHAGQKPVFETLKEGSLIYVEKINVDLRPAGLNFILKIEDLFDLLNRVRE
ncbi:hypothetical protein SJAV_26830 [Sulfurisphaera javensis]|uniref:Uncharacterized protein n=1 Tax=Sulfurisphaera javensis TaxID=2049879 RepID=A0AAT9GVB1_9CREN